MGGHAALAQDDDGAAADAFEHGQPHPRLVGGGGGAGEVQDDLGGVPLDLRADDLQDAGAVDERGGAADVRDERERPGEPGGERRSGPQRGGGGPQDGAEHRQGVQVEEGQAAAVTQRLGRQLGDAQRGDVEVAGGDRHPAEHLPQPQGEAAVQGAYAVDREHPGRQRHEPRRFGARHACDQQQRQRLPHREAQRDAEVHLAQRVGERAGGARGGVLDGVRRRGGQPEQHGRRQQSRDQQDGVAAEQRRAHDESPHANAR
ncbi:hypothetical protein ACFMQL_19190 [Nonomuraea fastidiosa]|uniref:hypothetical protein n=1 Tax=Nonomuraea fastidiosa TaxID=46173 RepID=UPI0036711552